MERIAVKEKKKDEKASFFWPVENQLRPLRSAPVMRCVSEEEPGEHCAAVFRSASLCF